MAPETHRDQFLHWSIQDGNIEEVKQFVERNPGRNHFYNDNKESAASVALKYEKLEIYELLISNGITFAPNEDVEAIVANASRDFRMKVRDINTKYSKDPKHKHIMSLVAKSKLSYNTDKHHEDIYFKAIVSAFVFLNEFELIEPILKVCALYKKLNIYFDFNNDSVEHMDPTKSKRDLGNTYPNTGFIYIGAKGLLFEHRRNYVLVTLIHQLCLFALNMTYRNKCKPYYADDSEMKEKFDIVIQKCREPREIEPLIENVFYVFPDYWPAELIVRVPQLIVFYSDNANKYSKVKNRFSALFKFFERHTIVDLENKYDKWPERNEIQNVNKNVGILTLTERTETLFEENFNIECNATENVVLITSNHPRLTMIYFYQLLGRQDSFNGHNIFTGMKLLKSDITIFKLVKSWDLSVKPTIFIECEGLEIDVEPLEKLLSLVENRRIVVIAKANLNLSVEAIEHKVEHTWNQLDKKVQHDLISKRIKFQGNKVSLIDLISNYCHEYIPLKYVLSDDMIVVGKQVETPQNEEQNYSYLITDQLDNSESRILNEIDELLKDNKCILLSNEPCMNNINELKMMAFKLKAQLPLSWVIIVDLKKFANSYQKTENVNDFENAEKIVEYLCENILYLEGFEAKVFENLFVRGKIVFLIDGFDEISEDFKEFVMNLLKAIVKSKNQIWISTRQNFEKEVETLEPKSLKIEPFTAQNQQDYFKQFCLKKGMDEESVDSYLKEIEVTSNVPNPKIIRKITEISDAPKNFGIVTLIERTQKKVNSNTKGNAIDVVLLTSKYPRFTMAYFYQLLRNKKHLKGHNIFISVARIESYETTEDLVKRTFFVECESSKINIESSLISFLGRISAERVVLVMRESFDISSMKNLRFKEELFTEKKADIAIIEKICETVNCYQDNDCDLKSALIKIGDLSNKLSRNNSDSENLLIRNKYGYVQRNKESAINENGIYFEQLYNMKFLLKVENKPTASEIAKIFEQTKRDLENDVKALKSCIEEILVQEYLGIKFFSDNKKIPHIVEFAKNNFESFILRKIKSITEQFDINFDFRDRIDRYYLAGVIIVIGELFRQFDEDKMKSSNLQKPEEKDFLEAFKSITKIRNILIHKPCCKIKDGSKDEGENKMIEEIIRQIFIILTKIIANDPNCAERLVINYDDVESAKLLKENTSEFYNYLENKTKKEANAERKLIDLLKSAVEALKAEKSAVEALKAEKSEKKKLDKFWNNLVNRYKQALDKMNPSDQVKYPARLTKSVVKEKFDQIEKLIKAFDDPTENDSTLSSGDDQLSDTVKTDADIMAYVVSDYGFSIEVKKLEDIEKKKNFINYYIILNFVDLVQKIKSRDITSKIADEAYSSAKSLRADLAHNIIDFDSEKVLKYIEENLHPAYFHFRAMSNLYKYDKKENNSTSVLELLGFCYHMLGLHAKAVETWKKVKTN